MSAPVQPPGRGAAFAVGWAIGARIRRALIATRDILDEAFASPGALSADDPDGMTRAQLVRALKRERDHALDLEKEILDLERARPPVSQSLVGEALDAADRRGAK